MIDLLRHLLTNDHGEWTALSLFLSDLWPTLRLWIAVRWARTFGAWFDATERRALRTAGIAFLVTFLGALVLLGLPQVAANVLRDTYTETP